MSAEKIVPFAPPETECADFGPTDLGNAVAFAGRYHDCIRFVARQRVWVYWTGKVWQEDPGDVVQAKAKQFAGDLLQEAAVMPDGDARKAAIRHALYTSSARGIAALLSLARNEKSILMAPEDFDADPLLLNCKNGVLDLREGRLRRHDRDLYMTKLAPVDFDPLATLDLWTRFLDDVTGNDPAMIDYLRRFAGYCLSGSTAEEKLVFIHGPAASGKSTFIAALSAALGDYAVTADFETFLQRRDVGGPRPDLARLAGARFVPSVEVDDGRKLAEGLVKLLVGGDTITVRKLYQEEFEFRPQFKLALVANDPPKMRADDGALWRRMVVIPFDRAIPPEKRDPRVKATLKDPTLAGPAILAWAHSGWLDYQERGLGTAPRIDSATAELRESNDPTRDFVDDCLTFTPDCWAESGAVYRAYKKWCEAEGEAPISPKNLAKLLTARGAKAGKRHQRRGWLGVSVVAP